MKVTALRGISINDGDERGTLMVDLKDIIEAAGERAMRSRWSMMGVEVSGESAADKMHRLSDAHLYVDGDELLELARNVVQVIEGTFEAFEVDHTSPWLVVHAVDSTVYDVITDDDQVLERLRTKYHEVTEVPISKYR